MNPSLLLVSALQNAVSTAEPRGPIKRSTCATSFPSPTSDSPTITLLIFAMAITSPVPDPRQAPLLTRLSLFAASGFAGPVGQIAAGLPASRYSTILGGGPQAVERLPTRLRPRLSASREASASRTANRGDRQSALVPGLWPCAFSRRSSARISSMRVAGSSASTSLAWIAAAACRAGSAAVGAVLAENMRVGEGGHHREVHRRSRPAPVVPPRERAPEGRDADVEHVGEAVRVVPGDAVAVLGRPHGFEQRDGRRARARRSPPPRRARRAQRARSPRNTFVGVLDVERVEHAADRGRQILRALALGGAGDRRRHQHDAEIGVGSRPPCGWRRSRRARARRRVRRAARSSPWSPRRRSRNRRRSCRGRRRNRARCRPSAPAARRGRRADRLRRSRPADRPIRRPCALRRQPQSARRTAPPEGRRS